MRDMPRPERSADTVTYTLVANVQVFVNEDCRVTLKKVAN